MVRKEINMLNLMNIVEFKVVCVMVGECYVVVIIELEVSYIEFVVYDCVFKNWNVNIDVEDICMFCGDLNFFLIEMQYFDFGLYIIEFQVWVMVEVVFFIVVFFN